MEEFKRNWSGIWDFSAKSDELTSQSGSLSQFEEQFPYFYHLMMLGADYDMTKLASIKQMNIQEFLFAIEYLLLRQKLQNQKNK